MQDSIFNLLTEEQLRGRNTLKWNYFGPDVVPLWLAEMDFPTAPAVLDGVRACVDNEEFGYPPLGEDSLPRATADWCRQRYGWCPRPDWVSVVPDVLKGMEVVVEFLTRPESPVALPGASTVGIRANIAAYHHGESWLDELLPYLRANRDHLARALPELAPGVEVNAPDGTYLSWVDFRALALPSEPAEYLLSKAKVALSPGIPFGAAVGSGFARLNFATTRAILDRAIEAIAAALRDIID
ncbi:hypothetical protein [Mycobacterium tuberculosis]|uniref:hypothetical protein n=1 Tax=Mycobacterium tuberculosis TaxID=1773 RepID=UPI00045A229B|nr:hypothetical protein [Mycobacterium tuberculosis]KAO02717.1 cystathionine beta-lyase [Mycobacterium tuberculosis variant bovis B2 7505]QJF20144.1 Aminotransferase [Mycobacterium tuberculosis]